MLFTEIQNCFPKIINAMEKDSIQTFVSSDYCSLYKYHFGLGTFIRNNLLKENSYLYNKFKAANITHKDDMSQLIITLLYIYLNEERIISKRKSKLLISAFQFCL